MSKAQMYIFILVFVLAVGVALWGVFGIERVGPGDDNGGEDTAVTSITVSEDSITDQSGDVLVSADNLPGSIEVNEDASFGAAGAISGGELSPDNQSIAFASRGAAHDAGWLYEVGSGEISPAAFQYGGGIEVIEWSPDSQFVAFRADTPVPSAQILIVDHENTDGYVSDISHQVRVEDQADTGQPLDYEFLRWEAPHTLCFSVADRDERCVEVEEVIAQSGDGDDGGSGGDAEPPADNERTVRLYYYNSDQDTDEQGNIMCSEAGLVSVERTITGVQTPITSTVELLLEGEITPPEADRGITTEFPLAGFTLEGVNLEDGVATLEFNDPQNSSSGGSCRVTILREQITETVLQFDAVDEVRIIPEDILQP